MNANRKMSEDEKRRFDAIFELYQSSWSQFNERRAYEFKISLTFWTALAAAVAGSMRLETLIGGRFTLMLVALFTFALHSIWCWGIGRTQFAQRQIAFSYERKLQELAGAEFKKELREFLNSLQETMGALKNWTYIFQLGVTAFLGATLVMANWNRFGPFSVFEMWALISLLVIVLIILIIVYLQRKKLGITSLSLSGQSTEER